MIYQVLNMVKDIKVCLDENVTSEQLIAAEDVDTLTFDEIVKSKILEAVERIETEAPVYYLEGGYNFGGAICWGTLESGWTLLPDDFMRLVVFKMDDWERAVYTAITPDDPEYSRQSSRFKGVRGTAQKPVCALITRPEGKVLEFYSCKSEDASVEQAVYLPYPEIDEDGGVEICQRCYTAVVYMAAALVLVSLGEAEKANYLMEKSRSLRE
jgi:hypothetical protein